MTPPLPPHVQQEIQRRLVDALAHHQRGELEAARTRYQSVLSLDPRSFDALHLLGVVTADLAGLDEGIALVRRALSVDGGQANAYYSLGLLLLRRHDVGGAIDALDRATRLSSGHVDAWFVRGNALHQAGRLDDALRSYERALKLRPEFPEALNNAAVALRALHRHAQALELLGRALALQGGYAQALNNRGLVELDLGRSAEAVASFRAALAAQPRFAEALHNLGIALMQARRPAEARDAFAQLKSIAPEFRHVDGNLLHAKLHCCDWSGHEQLAASVAAATERGAHADVPMQFLHVSDRAALQLACARLYTTTHYPPTAGMPTPRPAARLRLGYLSGDLGEHAISYLMTGVFERHDPARFETVAFSWGRRDTGARRARIERAFDRFIDITTMPDHEAVRLIREVGVDVLVDLAGHTHGQRTGILAARAAPVQVNFLGLPATMGASYIDYLIADRFLVPEEHRAHYAEQIVWLPETFQPNDDRRAFTPPADARGAHDLPTDAFVFCCFNNTAKFNPTMFSLWMRLLSEVQGSVLWLLAPRGEAGDNLRREAAARGVDPTRLVFAQRLPYEAYLARYGHADLFLDTLPFNGGTTASDALSAGLPVLTCAGGSFAGRMAGSLLRSLDLGELVATTLDDYLERARALAADPARLAALRARLAACRDSHPVFDTARYCRHLESAYLAMHEHRLAGLAPAPISVARLA